MATVCARKRKIARPKAEMRGLLDVDQDALDSLRHAPHCLNFDQKYVWCIPRPRILKWLWGLGIPFFHSNCKCNEIIAIANRALSPMESVTSVGESHLVHIRSAARRLGQSLSVVKLSRRSFVDSIKVPGKKKIYERAKEKLDKYGLDLGQVRLSTFTKGEQVHGESKDPRPIQAATPEYNIELGRYNKPIEEQLGRLRWDIAFPGAPQGRLIAKGLNNVQRGGLVSHKFDQFEEPVCLGIDASRFDLHASRPWLRVEFEIYKWAYQHDPYLLSLLRWQYGPRGRTSKGVKYTLNGGRCSGVPNTGSGNSFICCCLTLHYLTKRQVKFDFLCDGDDALIFLEKRDMHIMDGFSRYCVELGFKMVIEPPAYRKEDIEFCQSKPIEVTPGKWVMVRNPKRALYRGGMSQTSMATVVEAEQTLWAIGSCELALHSGVPVMQEYALWCLRNGTKPSQRKLAMLQVKLSHQYWELPKSQEPKPVTIGARITFAAAFGISISEQLLLEEAYRNSNFTMVGTVDELPAEDTGAGEVFSSDDRIYVL